jgi:hypothetical protein
MTETGICGAVRPFTESRCIREAEHPGQHKDANNAKWGGRRAPYTPQKITPLPEGKPIAPHRPPARPPASKFSDIPGQMAMDAPTEQEAARLVTPAECA